MWKFSHFPPPREQKSLPNKDSAISCNRQESPKLHDLFFSTPAAVYLVSSPILPRSLSRALVWTNFPFKGVSAIASSLLFSLPAFLIILGAKLGMRRLPCFNLEFQIAWKIESWASSIKKEKKKEWTLIMRFVSWLYDCFCSAILFHFLLLFCLQGCCYSCYSCWIWFWRNECIELELA